MKSKLLLIVAFLFIVNLSKAQGRTEDSLNIIKTCLDYIDGFYSSDGARMESALHPELAKRIITRNANGWEELGQMSALTLVQGTKSHTPTPVEKRQHDIFVQDIFREAAAAKIIASDWVDFLQLHKWHGHWVIVNVLWELKK